MTSAPSRENNSTDLSSECRSGILVRIMRSCLLSLLLSLAGAIAHAQLVAIPSYFYPGSLWTQMDDGAPTASLAIINPNSGPGASIDSNYVTTTQQAQTSGLTVLGYVHTSYAARNTTTVKTEIDTFYSWYAVDGIFLDEVDTNCTNQPYYANLHTYIKSKGGKAIVALNPGTYPSECYMASGDILCVFEDTYANYLGNTPPAWVANYSRRKFWHIIHTTSSAANMSNTLSLAQSRNAGWIYITDDSGANPYDTLPSYWTQELQATSPTFVPVRLSILATE